MKKKSTELAVKDKVAIIIQIVFFVSCLLGAIHIVTSDETPPFTQLGAVLLLLITGSIAGTGLTIYIDKWTNKNG